MFPEDRRNIPHRPPLDEEGQQLLERIFTASARMNEWRKKDPARADTLRFIRTCKALSVCLQILAGEPLNLALYTRILEQLVNELE